MITVLYFARIKENLGTGRESIALPPSANNVATLTAWLRERGGAFQTELAPGKALRVAINQTMVAMDAAIKDGDEIAYFPPVTGG